MAYYIRQPSIGVPYREQMSHFDTTGAVKAMVPRSLRIGEVIKMIWKRIGVEIG